MQYSEIMKTKRFIPLSEYKEPLIKGTLIGFVKNNILIESYPVFSVRNKYISYVIGKRDNGDCVLDRVVETANNLVINFEPIIIDVNEDIVTQTNYVVDENINKEFVIFEIAFLLRKRNFRQPVIAAYYVFRGVPVLRANLISCIPENVNLNWLQKIFKNEYYNTSKQVLILDYNIPIIDIQKIIDEDFKNTGIKLLAYAEKDLEIKETKPEFLAITECFSAPTYEQVREFLLKEYHIFFEIRHERKHFKSKPSKSVYVGYYVNTKSYKRYRANRSEYFDSYEECRDKSLIDILKINLLFS